MTDLRDRIEQAIARVPAAKAADAVLATIAETHVLVERAALQSEIEAYESAADGAEPWHEHRWSGMACALGDVLDGQYSGDLDGGA